MRRNCWRFLTSTFLGLVIAIMAGATLAAPRVVPPNSNAYGMGYDELAAAWLEWVTSIPNESSPLFDMDGSDAAIGQRGPVWFLAGTLGGTVTRTINVPAGKSLFFPVANYFWINTPELGDQPWSPAQEAFVRSLLAGLVDTGQNLVLQIDGQTIPNVYELLRASSTVGTCMLPADDLLGADTGPHECVADGFWALLPPLSSGHHTVHFAGEFGAVPGFAVNVTYHITAGPR